MKPRPTTPVPPAEKAGTSPLVRPANSVESGLSDSPDKVAERRKRKKTMVKVNPSSSVVALAILIFGLSDLPLNAQQSEEFQPRNVISANPIGLLINTFNGEFERVISPTSTIGFG